MQDLLNQSSDLLHLPAGYRPRHAAAIWQKLPDNWRDELAAVLERRADNSNPPRVFFRADDVGAGGRPFESLCGCFRRHQIPLALAVVPAWLSPVRIEQLFRTAPQDEPLWAWHQHGWRHVNWQRNGKKSEFGEHRPFERQWRDIWQGRQKMMAVFQDHFVSVFSPPWNRLSWPTMRILQELGFLGVSLDGPFPKNMKYLPNLRSLRVHIDLHTRKSKDGSADYQHLLGQLRNCLTKKEPCGIMVHHQLMTVSAFAFLEELLRLLRYRVHARFLSFHDLLSDA